MVAGPAGPRPKDPGGQSAAPPLGTGQIRLRLRRLSPPGTSSLRMRPCLRQPARNSHVGRGDRGAIGGRSRTPGPSLEPPARGRGVYPSIGARGSWGSPARMLAGVEECRRQRRVAPVGACRARGGDSGRENRSTSIEDPIHCPGRARGQALQPIRQGRDALGFDEQMDVIVSERVEDDAEVGRTLADGEEGRCTLRVAASAVGLRRSDSACVARIRGNVWSAHSGAPGDGAGMDRTRGRSPRGAALPTGSASEQHNGARASSPPARPGDHPRRRGAPSPAETRRAVGFRRDHRA